MCSSGSRIRRKSCREVTREDEEEEEEEEEVHEQEELW